MKRDLMCLTLQNSDSCVIWNSSIQFMTPKKLYHEKKNVQESNIDFWNDVNLHLQFDVKNVINCNVGSLLIMLFNSNSGNLIFFDIACLIKPMVA